MFQITFSLFTLLYILEQMEILLMRTCTVKQLNIPTLPIDKPKEVLAIDGKFLVKVSLMTVPLSLTLSGNHHESYQPLVISSPLSQIVLDLLWLSIHTPVVDWSTVTICSCSKFCHTNCLRARVLAGASSPSVPPEE